MWIKQWKNRGNAVSLLLISRMNSQLPLFPAASCRWTDISKSRYILDIAVHHPKKRGLKWSFLLFFTDGSVRRSQAFVVVLSSKWTFLCVCVCVIVREPYNKNNIVKIYYCCWSQFCVFALASFLFDNYNTIIVQVHICICEYDDAIFDSWLLNNK